MESQIYAQDDIVYVVEEDLLSNNLRLLDEKFLSLADYNENNISLDMGRVEALDSLFISILIRFRSRLSMGGRTLRLINCNEKVIHSIRLAALDEYFLF